MTFEEAKRHVGERLGMRLPYWFGDDNKCFLDAEGHIVHPTIKSRGREKYPIRDTELADPQWQLCCAKTGDPVIYENVKDL